MRPTKPEISPLEYEAIQRMRIRENMSLHELCQRFSHLRKHDIREVIAGISPKQKMICPCISTIESRKEEVRKDWTTHDWGMRWVGRYAPKKETIHQAASRLIER